MPCHPYLDLTPYAADEKERRTLEAMQRGEPSIYSARIKEDGLLGDPDLLRKEGDGHIVGDAKSGSGEAGPEISGFCLARHPSVRSGIHRVA